MKKQMIVCVMIGVAPFFSSLASFDWSKHIEDWNGFVQNYEQCKEARRQFDSATNDIVRLTAKIAAVATEHPKSDVDLKIGEFEEMGDFQARVEQQRKQQRKHDEKLRQDKRAELEKQRQQYINEARLHIKDIKECTLRMSAFTNRTQSAYCMSEKALPYFDRDSMSFKDIPNPFYLESGNDRDAENRKVKFVVNAEKADFDNARLPVNLDRQLRDAYDRSTYTPYDGTDSFTHWIAKTGRELNVNVAKTVSLRFKRLGDAQKFKKGVSAGTIKVRFCCEFNVGMPADWIVRQGHWEREVETNPVLNFLGDVDDFLHGYSAGRRTHYSDREHWCGAVMGVMVPIDIKSSKIIIEGETVESINIEIVSPTGSWTLEKRCTMGE